MNSGARKECLGSQRMGCILSVQTHLFIHSDSTKVRAWHRMLTVSSHILRRLQPAG